jgi:GT2 family glycosyltransferase
MEQESNKPIELPFVSILMVNYNGQVHLKEFFESVFRLNYPKNKYEVVVVDNASKDGSPDWIDKNYSQVKLIRLAENTGFARGNNIGVSHCRGRFTALINNDTVLTRDWLTELVKQAVKEPDAIFTSKMLFYDRRDHIAYGGANLFFWGQGYFPRVYEKDDDKELQPSPVLCASGCGVLIPKDLFLKLGGFDESYFCYAEDFEISWKAWLMGYRVYYIPTARFYHKVSMTMGGNSHLLIYLLYRNDMRNIVKLAGTTTLISMLPLFMAYSYAMYFAVYCLQEKQFSLIWPILKANFRILYEIPGLLPVRKKIQKERKIRDKDLKKMGLILPLGESIKSSLAVLRRRGEFIKGQGN